MSLFYSSAVCSSNYPNETVAASTALECVIARCASVNATTWVPLARLNRPMRGAPTWTVSEQG